MADPRSSAHNGALPRESDMESPAGASQMFTRPFTLYEALPYTPFTSIVPIHSGLLPAPSIGSASPAPSLSDIVPSHDFDGLNEQARTGEGFSKHLQQTVNQVQQIIKHNKVTEFKFKTGPRSVAPSSSRSKPISLASGLSPVSKMVYEQNLVSFRYPTPDTPGTKSPPGDLHKQNTPVQTKASPVAVKAELQKQSSATPKNKQAHARNAAKFEIVLPTKSQLEQAANLVSAVSSVPVSAVPAPVRENSRDGPRAQLPQPSQPPTVLPRSSSAGGAIPVTPNQPPPKVQPGSGSPKTVIAVELPRSSFNKSEFLVVPDEPDEPTTLSERKRKRDGLDEDDHYGESLDLRQRAHSALNELRVFLHHVFEAENHVLATRTANDFVGLTVDNATTLSSLAQTKVQALLSKAISLNCYQDVPIEELLRLCRLCEGAVKQAESLDFKIEETWGSADVETWLQQLPDLEMAIRAARTLLRTMCGGRADKQLYSEDMIEKCLDLFKRIADGIIVPVAALRNTGSTAELFKSLCSCRKKLVALLNDFQKLFSLMVLLISKVDTSSTVSNTLEFAASRLIFMESANAEKDSVIDTQKFDGLRLVAMDMLSQIFLLNESQRQGIFDEILTSLEKLPIRRRARTFKLMDGSSIQPVSALIMRLIQTSAGKVDDATGAGQSRAMQSIDGGDGEVPSLGSATFSIRTEEHAATQHQVAIKELAAVVEPLISTANANAMYVIQFIGNKALRSSKSSEDPYRNLFDLFVEDFTICLDNPDWPAAGLLLWRLTVQMIALLTNEKSAVTAKNMALEVLGNVGGALAKLRGQVRKTASALDARDANELGLFLTDLAASALEQKSRPEQMVTWVGPFRVTLEYLESRYSEDPHLASAISFLVSTWGNTICESYDAYEDSVAERDEELGRLAYRLRNMIRDRRWLSSEFSFKDVSASQAKLSYGITLLRSKLYDLFGHILNRLLHSMASDQPTVRSKGLKSINQVLEADPSILDDSQVIELVLQCAEDSSTQVRDSALGLIGNCITLRPSLEAKLFPRIVEMFVDQGPGVRKRAMKLAKDMYLNNTNRSLRAHVANGLLHRVQDPEESVRDLARQMVEEIWFLPFQGGESSAASKISLSDHVALMVHTIKRGNASNILDKVLQTLLAPQTKTSQASLEVCKKLVESMFELVNNTDSGDASTPSGRDVLQVLMIFAKADARLFTFEQLRLLKPQIETLSACDDMAAARAAVTIYRRVLPQLSSAHQDFLRDIHGILLPVLGRAIPRTLLDEIVGCLSIICAVLNDKSKIARVTTSSLAGIQKTRMLFQKTKTLGERETRQICAYSSIVGMIGKHFSLEDERDAFKDRCPPNYAGTVSKLIIDTLLPWTAEAMPLECRKSALDAIGLVCQNAPKNYVSANVYTTFQRIFDSQTPALESLILHSFKEFLLVEEHRSEEGSEATGVNGVKKEKKRELTVMGGTNYDEVASATTHRFLKEITRIAMSTEDEHAFLAVEVLASINRQGLVHPKETGVTFITLETSSNPHISELAFQQHKRMHEKHETVVEREYVKALQSAFAYQRDIVKNSRGATTNPFSPKLHLMMEVLKISKSKNRQKFLDKLCAQVDFDLSKLDASSGDIPSHVEYSRFIIENIAFFEYVTVGEVHNIVAAMEKLVSSTGATVAQAIESEVFAVRMDALDSAPDPSAQLQAESMQVDVKRLRQLTAGSMILSALWEARTYLRKLYGMGTNRREGKIKGLTKDLGKPPVKAQGVTGDKFWEDISAIMTSLTSREGMMERCRAFVELMTVDKELLVQDDDDDMNGDEPLTPDNEDEDDMDEPSSGRGRKRKAMGNTPGGRKKRARSSSQPRKRGRPKKQVTEDMDADGEFDDWA
ncbi:sister chromatid cohesion C-terminus-domain-containing protein [Echria macrotheca]|uniref:Sister chromatid cohesion protein n=1 Tax=Echria macrotheca TaxID=438768 RepID=A0AAJ0BK84_9PEZI|nr:sister chromatid cohesion C-terminus-domain-containing protein [Echria macrotheca]